MEHHIMPASAPMGVRHAPRLEPTTVAITAEMGAVLCKIEEYSTLMGILLFRFAAKNEVMPYSHTDVFLLIRCQMASVTPFTLSASTNTNIDRIKGISSHGARFKQAVSVWECVFL